MIIENFKDDKEALRAMTGELIRYMDRKDDGLPFNLALSGGGTAQKMFALWVDEYKDKIDWDAIRFFWVDERCVPPTDPDSNYGHANELLFKPLHIPAGHVHRIHGEVEPGTEAMRYSRVVKEYLPRHGQLPYFDAGPGLGDGKERDARRVEKRLFGNPSYACRLYPYSCGRGVCIHDLMIRWGGVRIKKRFNCKK